MRDALDLPPQGIEALRARFEQAEHQHHSLVRNPIEQLPRRASDIFRVQDGQLAEHWDVLDVYGLFKQLGVVK